MNGFVISVKLSSIGTHLQFNETWQISLHHQLTLDFGEVKTAPTECKEKCFQMMLSAYLHYTKAPQNVLMLIHLRKRSGRYVIHE